MFSLPLDISRTVSVHASSDKVFNTIADFQTWKSWSPWLCQDPDCKVNISGDAGSVGHSQAWESDRIGSGNMELVALQHGKSITYKLQFLKPWKSESKVQFVLEESNGAIQVTWYMWGTLPIFIFFMKKMMLALIGNDYERGLSMLKDLVETGEVLSKLDIKGKVAMPAMTYIGIRRQCAYKDIKEYMDKDFTHISEKIQSGELPQPDAVITVYHNADMVKGTFDYTAGVCYNNEAPLINSTLSQGTIGAHEAFRVDHQGTYKHLGNAWATVYSAIRADKLKQNKSLPSYEIYRNDPMEV